MHRPKSSPLHSSSLSANSNSFVGKWCLTLRDCDALHTVEMFVDLSIMHHRHRRHLHSHLGLSLIPGAEITVLRAHRRIASKLLHIHLEATNETEIVVD